MKYFTYANDGLVVFFIVAFSFIFSSFIIPDSETLIDGNGCAVVNGYTTICSGETSTLTASGGTIYSWSTGSTTPSISVNAGTYTVTVTGSGCNTTVSVVVTEDPTCSTSVYQLCKTVNEATIAPDRNAWINNGTGEVSEGYLFNFENTDLPTNCELILDELDISIELYTYVDNTGSSCNFYSFFGNVYNNCGLNAVCNVAQDILTPGCNTFGFGTTTNGLYTLDPLACNSNFANVNSTIGVDVIPAMSFLGSCGSNETAITDNLISANFTICTEFKYQLPTTSSFLR